MRRLELKADKGLPKLEVGSEVGTNATTTATTNVPANIDGVPSLDVLAERLRTQNTLGGLERTPAPTIRYPKLAKLIDSANDHLALHLVHLRDQDTVDRLLAAQARGVDTHIVVTKKDRLSFHERMNLLALEGAGVDIVVRKTIDLAARAGLVDDKAFISPPRGGGVHVVDTQTIIANTRRVIDAALKTHAPIHREGLLEPGRTLFHAMPESGAGPILNAIKSATKSIDLEVYQLTEPSVVAALEEAAANGIRVRVMLEPKTVEKGNYEQMAARLLKAGIDVKPTPPRFDSHHNVDHAKMLIIDEQEVLIGTGNLVRSGLGGNDRPEANNRDFWVEDSRVEMVAEAVTLFGADWDRRPTSAADFQHLVVTPDNDESKIFALMDAATDRLLVYNQSLSDEETIQHLLAAKERGVKDIRVMLGVQPGPNGRPKNDPAVQRLRAAGIQVVYMTEHYLHAKGVISDHTAFLGSQNFTDGGLERNREVGVILNQPRTVEALVHIFDGDFPRGSTTGTN